jgi:hypothetical protein
MSCVPAAAKKHHMTTEAPAICTNPRRLAADRASPVRAPAVATAARSSRSAGGRALLRCFARARCLAVIPKPRWMPRSLDSCSTRERRASNEGCGERLRGEGCSTRARRWTRPLVFASRRVSAHIVRRSKKLQLYMSCGRTKASRRPPIVLPRVRSRRSNFLDLPREHALGTEVHCP